MAIYSGFYPLKMVIAHSYVSLQEGNMLVMPYIVMIVLVDHMCLLKTISDTVLAFLPVISTYNPIYRMYNSIEISSYN